MTCHEADALALRLADLWIDSDPLYTDNPTAGGRERVFDALSGLDGFTAALVGMRLLDILRDRIGTVGTRDLFPSFHDELRRRHAAPVLPA
jgi:hypothetical protein